MTNDVRESLFQALAQLSSLYPEMRFGQLIEFVCVLAGVEAPADLDECRGRGSDDGIAQAHPKAIASVRCTEARLCDRVRREACGVARSLARACRLPTPSAILSLGR